MEFTTLNNAIAAMRANPSQFPSDTKIKIGKDIYMVQGMMIPGKDVEEFSLVYQERPAPKKKGGFDWHGFKRAGEIRSARHLN
jgi:hypothetical protein